MVGYTQLQIRPAFTRPPLKKDGMFATIGDACSDLLVAAELGESWNAAVFMPVPQSDWGVWRHVLYTKSDGFDYDRTMLYPGRQRETNADGTRKDILVRVDVRGSEEDEFSGKEHNDLLEYVLYEGVSCMRVP
jgi:hypothetical protein